MNYAKILGIGMVVLGEVEQDLKDGKLTIDEVLGTVKNVADKLGYGEKVVLNFTTNSAPTSS